MFYRRNLGGFVCNRSWFGGQRIKSAWMKSVPSVESAWKMFSIEGQHRIHQWNLTIGDHRFDFLSGFRIMRSPKIRAIHCGWALLPSVKSQSRGVMFWVIYDFLWNSETTKSFVLPDRLGANKKVDVLFFKPFCGATAFFFCCLMAWVSKKFENVPQVHDCWVDLPTQWTPPAFVLGSSADLPRLRFRWGGGAGTTK